MDKKADSDTQPRVQRIAGLTIRYTKYGAQTARSTRAIQRVRKQMGAWEAAGIVADSPLYSMNDPWALDTSEMTSDLAHFADTVPQDDPDKELCELVYLRLVAFNDALAYFIGRLQERREVEKLAGLGAALVGMAHHLAADAAGECEVPEQPEDTRAAETRLPTPPADLRVVH